LRRQPSLRSQLNQIRLWVRQGRTDAWIAHKLDVSIDQLERFKRDHDLAEGGAQGRPADPLSVPPPEPESYMTPEPEDDEEPDEPEEPEEAEEAEPRRAPRRSRSRGRGRDRSRERERDEEDAEDEEAAPVEAESDDAGAEDGEPRPRRRRGRRGGRRRRRPSSFEATFDHGEDGYGLWLDPAVVDNPVYAEHWAGHRAVVVTVERDVITIRRADTEASANGDQASAEEPDENEALD